jgi:hypothetical protein
MNSYCYSDRRGAKIRPYATWGSVIDHYAKLIYSFAKSGTSVTIEGTGVKANEGNFIVDSIEMQEHLKTKDPSYYEKFGIGYIYNVTIRKLLRSGKPSQSKNATRRFVLNAFTQIYLRGHMTIEDFDPKPRQAYIGYDNVPERASRFAWIEKCATLEDFKKCCLESSKHIDWKVKIITIDY